MTNPEPRRSVGPIAVRVGFDIGGTFTDVVISASTARLFTFKVLSEPEAIARRVSRCIHEVLAEVPGGTVDAIMHGTTVASNAVIENKRAATGYLTTRGFRDDTEFSRPRFLFSHDSVSMFFPPMTPLVPRQLRLELDERMSALGQVERPLNDGAVEEALDRLLASGIEALAVCLVNAHVNSAHEQRIVEIARRQAPHLDIVASHEVSPMAGEYERGTTAILHASLMPVVKSYLDKLEADLGEFPNLLIEQANGGVIPTERAKQRPANLIESGPAAGVLAAAAVAREAGIQHAVALDMGGTTVKVCLIEDGRPRETVQMEVSLDTSSRLVKGSGHALLTSGFDLVEIGAGGGSIAWLDDGGALRVGPASAGASPGPACYGLGGDRPTITDAGVVLGYLNPVAIAGGTVAIRPDLAHEAVEDYIAGPAGMTVREAAHGICRVAVASMRRAVRMVTIQRGCDPRQCTLIAFGGAAPLLAAWLADELEIGTVYVPPHAGLFSALGLLTADVRFDAVAPLTGRLDQIDGGTIRARHQEMLERATAELAGTGVDVSDAHTERSIDLRYIRQGSELSIPVPDDVPAEKLPDVLTETFHWKHERQFGYRPDAPVVATSLRLRTLIRNDGFRLSDAEREVAGSAVDTGPSGRRTAYFGAEAGELEVPLYARAALVDEQLAGPAVIEEFDTTVVVPPGWKVSIGKVGSIVMERG